MPVTLQTTLLRECVPFSVLYMRRSVNGGSVCAGLFVLGGVFFVVRRTAGGV